MTNDTIVPALLAAASTNDLQFESIVCDGGPAWPFFVTLAWFLLSVGAPVLSFVLCVRAWLRRKRGQPAPRPTRAILVATLLTLTATLVNVFAVLGRVLLVAATSSLGSAGRAMCLVDGSRCCTFLVVGLSACSVCLLCLLLLPARRSETSDTSHGPLGSDRRPPDSGG